MKTADDASGAWPRTGAPVGRDTLLRRGVMLEGVTVGYNTLEGVVALAAGLAAGSVALTGFGADSIIEVVSGAVFGGACGRNWVLRRSVRAWRHAPLVGRVRCSLDWACTF